MKIITDNLKAATVSQKNIIGSNAQKTKKLRPFQDEFKSGFPLNLDKALSDRNAIASTITLDTKENTNQKKWWKPELENLIPLEVFNKSHSEDLSDHKEIVNALKVLGGSKDFLKINLYDSIR